MKTKHPKQKTELKTIVFLFSLVFASNIFAQNYYEQYTDKTTESHGGSTDGTPYRGNMIYWPNAEEERVHGQGPTTAPPGAGFEYSGTPYRGNMIEDNPSTVNNGVKVTPVPSSSVGTPYRGNMLQGPTESQSKAIGKGPIGSTVDVVNSGTAYRGNYKP